MKTHIYVGWIMAKKVAQAFLPVRTGKNACATLLCTLLAASVATAQTTLRIVATVGGEAVPATISVGTSQVRAPRLFQLKPDGKYTFTLDYSDSEKEDVRYEGTYSVVADWEGAREEILELSVAPDTGSTLDVERSMLDVSATQEERSTPDVQQLTSNAQQLTSNTQLPTFNIQQSTPWRLSAGAGMRMGVKVEGKGGTFDLKPTGFVRANPSDPASSLGLTSDWGVDNYAPGVQIHNPDGTYLAVGGGGTSLYYMDFETLSGKDNVNASMLNIELALSRDLLGEDAFTLGLRLTLGGSLGLSQDISATSRHETHVFAETVTTTPVPGTSYVGVNPTNSVTGQSTSLDVKGSLWKLGIGTEIALVDDDYTKLGLVLYPFVSVNMVTVSVDGAQRDAHGDPVPGMGISATENKLLVGSGITATVTYDVSDRLGLGFSAGYEYLPKLEISDDGGNGLGAEIGFSGFTLGANVMWRF